MAAKWHKTVPRVGLCSSIVTISHNHPPKTAEGRFVLNYETNKEKKKGGKQSPGPRVIGPDVQSCLHSKKHKRSKEGRMRLLMPLFEDVDGSGYRLQTSDPIEVSPIACHQSTLCMFGNAEVTAVLDSES